MTKPLHTLLPSENPLVLEQTSKSSWKNGSLERFSNQYPEVVAKFDSQTSFLKIHYRAYVWVRQVLRCMTCIFAHNIEVHHILIQVFFVHLEENVESIARMMLCSFYKQTSKHLIVYTKGRIPFAALKMRSRESLENCCDSKTCLIG